MLPAEDDGAGLYLLALAATRRDGAVTRDLLDRAGIACELCADVRSLVAAMAPRAGALLLTDASFRDPELPSLIAALAAQPPWSELPVLVFARERSRSAHFAETLQALRNVTVLDYPTSARAMVSAVDAALRGRRRQFQIRDRMVAQHEAEAALREADRRKDEFVATLAHELRNPLAAIATAVALMSRKPEGDPERSLRMLGMMDRQTRLLVKLIDDLLDVSRVATGKMVLSLEPIDLRSVVEAALETSRAVVEAAGHALELALPAGPVVVSGDPQRLAQAVGNLLGNAAKYTSPGGHIRVSLGAEGEDAWLRVSDDGAGIPPEMLGRVFDLFAQVNQTLDRAQGGLGIGLSLVKRLVELHGGTVTGASEGSGLGSTFSIRLPLLLPGAGVAPMAGPAEGTAQRVASKRSLRVLVVDDNPDVADTFAALLQSDGHVIRTAYDGPDGLTANDAFRPDVVFCDIGLPGMTGHEVAARLRADPKNAGTVLVAVTGWGNEEDRRRTREAGFDAHLTKPVDPQELGDILARM